MRRRFAIDGRAVGPGSPPWIVAEMSGNHNRDLDRALAILEAAHAAGADAVKLQTYTPDTMTLDCDRPDFLVADGPWKGRRLYELYEEAHTPWEWQGRLFERGRELGLTVFSTPFDASAVEFLERLGAPAYKIASFELVDLALVERAAATRKPLLLSTGLASLAEIGEAVAVARAAGCEELILMHCVSAYPAPVEESNLRTIPHLADVYDVLVGLSDHSLGTDVAIAATALGAVAIEKHFTLRRADGGVDAAFSLEPPELAALVAGTRRAQAAVGFVDYRSTRSEAASMCFRRSLYVVEDVPRGAPLTARNVRSIRPGFGLAPKHLPRVLGKRAARDLQRGEPLSLDMVTPAEG